MAIMWCAVNDWQYFVDAINAILHGHSPYTVPGFYSPPYTLVFVFPLAWVHGLPAHLLPLIALTYAAHRKRKPLLIPIVAFSIPFMFLISSANVDWLPMLGTLSFGRLQAVLLATRPQTAGVALVAYLHRDRWRKLIPLAALLLAGYVLWRWPAVLSGNNPARAEWNISQVAYTWPLGVYGAWRCWRDGDLMWGCIASVALSPYFSTYSLVPALYKIAERKLWLGALLSVASWGYVPLVVA